MVRGRGATGRATSGTARQNYYGCGQATRSEAQGAHERFEVWLESNGRSPEEMSLETRLSQLLGKNSRGNRPFRSRLFGLSGSSARSIS